MPALFIYLLKLSVSLAVVFLFYQLLLRRLTFYNSNRWYLLAYTILSFIIPFVDISLMLHKNEWSEINIVQWVPVIYKPAIEEGGSTASINYWFIGSLFIMAGMLFMLVRLLIQFISFRRMMKKAEFISGDEMKIYQVNDSINPFSFGNSIFINRHLHTEEELKEIIRHEFIHVKQRHSCDIIWAEILCLINWYNPFAWLLRKSIRQNLEFIADNKVLENGISKKEYQYLLLKVTGNNQYSIATQFNFSSLKKRIAMMNKLKSTKRQLLRMLFLLPATIVLLLAFRNQNESANPQPTFNLNEVDNPIKKIDYQLRDTVPEVTEPNSKGYIINIKDKSGECEIVIKDKNKKEVKRLLLTVWNKTPEMYEKKYGEIPPPPPPLPNSEQWFKAANPAIKSLSINNNLATVILNDGKKENYDLNNAEQKNSFEKKYGEVLPPPPPPPPAKPTAPKSVELPANVKKININFDKAEVWLINGKKENYNLTVPVEKMNFEKKYGEMSEPPEPPELPAPAKKPSEMKKVKISSTESVADVETTPIAISEFPKNKNVGIVPITVAEYPIKKGLGNEAITVAGFPTNLIVGKESITVAEFPVNNNTINSKGKLANLSEQPLSSIGTSLVENAIISIGGLSMQNDGQYILVDGKEPESEYNGTIKGTYRITFLDKADALKKYGEKAKNGAVILETIKSN